MLSVFSKKVVIHLKNRGDTIHLEPLGDIHVGHVGTDTKHYKRRIKAICKDPNRYTLFMGDQLDAINIYDKRFNPDAVTDHEIDGQRQKWQDMTQPLIDQQLDRSKRVKVIQRTYDKRTDEVLEDEVNRYVLKEGENPKVWGLMHGNHEYKIKELSRTYMENHFCFNNGIDFLGAKCYISLTIMYKKEILLQLSIMAMHGAGGGDPNTMLKQMKQNNYCDIFFCAHLHQKFYKEEEVMDMDHDTGLVEKRPIYLANTGTFCEFMTESVSGYGDQKNQVVGTPIGTATISITAATGKVSGHI